MAEPSNMKAHRETFEGVMGLLKWGSVATAIITIIVVILISG